MCGKQCIAAPTINQFFRKYHKMYNLTGNTADKPVEVKCEFTVDNEVLSVEYNDVQLEIKSNVNCTNSNQVDDNCSRKWTITKTFSFLFDGYDYDAI